MLKIANLFLRFVIFLFSQINERDLFIAKIYIANIRRLYLILRIEFAY